ncbi:sigma 54-interacting transcriptional regulator [Thermoanaerobacterium sp. DL9XJH110]|uniref:sigma 54-interacting transcriptional regulator n=1 Tax=Thermoanaerobacterium sp. DL9XJH110 TaxID=3386643 RepID=UPI003BB69ECB
MKREEIIFNKLRELCTKKYKHDNWNGSKKFGLSAQELSEILEMDRANISKDLNNLVKKEKVIKFVGRPTLFFPVDMIKNIYKLEEINSFEISSIDEILNQDEDKLFNIIGLQGSLKSCFEQLNMAILYPPFGLHTLLYGKTGVGKSMLADLMYSIAQKKVPEKFKTYVTFNCADYAQNPNLLMTELFGCIKGAYTGADVARKGIIENANNGILFLDEVHRLPPEGQEMLFYVMDKGVFRRVGETKEFTRVNVLIICATTEKPESVLLPAFYRRIPMKIYVPDYSERPVDERKRLIEFFFNNECRILNKAFKVDSRIIDLLCNYDCRGNVGQLKNDIKLMSARAFARALTNNDNTITISYEDAAEVIGHNNTNVRDIPKNYVIFNGRGCVYQDTGNGDDDLYENLLNKLNELSLQNCSKEEIEKSLINEINKYFKLNPEEINFNFDAIKMFVEDEIIEQSKIVLDLAKEKLNKSYNNSNILTLSLHLKTTINRLKSGQPIKNNKINYIRKNYPKEFMIALEAAEKIEKNMSVSIPLSEVGFLTLFLVSLDNKNNHSRVGILVACHGDNIASSMLKLANKLLGKNIGQAIDIPLEKSVEITISEIIETVKKIDEGKGVLVLVDMGLISNAKDIIRDKSGVKVEIIEKVSTPMLIRAIEKSLIFDGTVEEFKKEIISDYYQDAICYEIQKDDVNEKNLIVIYCITGKGTAIRLKEFILKNMRENLLDKVEIIIEDKEFIHLTEEEVKLKYGEKILAIVGTLKNNFRDIPYISAEEIFLQDGIRKLSLIIESTEGYNPYKEGELSLSKVLKFVNPNLLVKELRKILLAFENHFNKKLDPKIVAIIILHIGCMVEDLILGKKLKTFDNFSYVYQKYDSQVQYLKDLLKQIENIFNISIPDSEIARIIEIIMEN